MPRPQTSLQSGIKSEEYLHTHWDCQAEVYNIYVLSCNSEESKRLILKLKNKGDFPGGPLVRNLPSQCKGHRFDPWLRNYDPTCCGATKPVHHKEWSQRTQQRACLLPLRLSATTLNRKLRNKKQKSNGVMQMPFQNKPRGKKKMPFCEVCAGGQWERRPPGRSSVLTNVHSGAPLSIVGGLTRPSALQTSGWIWSH